jgi:hypothetical protein
MAYDASRGCVVMTGGYLANGSPLNDIWEWNGITWRQRVPDTVLASAAYNHSLVYDSVRGRCVRFGGTDGISQLAETYDIYALVDVIGAGHASGGLPFLTLSPPAIGNIFRLWFDLPSSVGSLLVGRGSNPVPAFTLSPPLFCSTATFWTNPLVSVSLGAMPQGGIPLPIPANPSLVGGTLAFQGISMQPTSCLLATDALNVRIFQP